MPFAREYGGVLANRSFGGAQVSRTFYARGQTGQQLLLGAYQALSRQIAAKRVVMNSRSEMLDLVVVDGHARGIVTRDMVTGEIHSHAGAGAEQGAAHVRIRHTDTMELQVVNLTLRVWRQKHARHRGGFETYNATDVSPDMSFLETLDAVNEDLILKGEDPIAFDHDCREESAVRAAS